MSTDINWHPLTPDVVFEDGGIYLLKDKEDGSVGLATWMQSAYGFAISIDYLENKERFTHYARVNEP